MRTARYLHALALPLAAALCLPALSPAASEGVTRRFALAIAAHEGDKDRARLLYSGSDALAFTRTLEELGGLSSGDSELLTDPDSAALEGAFDRLAARVAAAKKAGARAEAIVYYSGHADERGLQLGGDRFDYRAFRKRMNALGADVRIAVVDACASGALTRMKGGTPVPAFMVDKSARAEGYAFLTSSSESEVAQESDRLRGSFFTHALNTGLRGAADASRDGRVTLHEAYQFAYHETLDRTASTRGGPQHAGYEMQLSGSGDVVLTDLRQATSSLVLAEELHGRLFIRDSLGVLLADLQKPAGREVNLGLPPGRYELRLQSGGAWSAASTPLLSGRSTVVAAGSFKAVEGQPAAAAPATADSATFHHVPVTGEAGFSSAIFYNAQKEPWHGTQLALVATDAHSHLRGGQLALAANVTRGDLEGYQAAVGFNAVGGSLHGFQISQVNVVSGHLQGVQVGGVLGIAGEHVRGLQASGVFNVAGGALDGWQLAGVFDIACGPVRGAQAAGVFTAASDSVRGAQGAGIFNVSGGKVLGGQGAGIFNVSGKGLTGGQGAGIFNASGGDVRGGQGAGIFNATWGNVRGGQGAGIFNVASGNVQGVQGAGIFNFSRGLKGLQAAAILNVTGRANGYQIGIINLSNEYESGVPIGLVNVSRKGSFEAEAWTEETGLVFAGLRTGAGVFNIAGDSVTGGQGAGVFNIAGGGIRGVQAAGVLNVAPRVGGSPDGGPGAPGFQIAGVLNVAGKVNGYQIGLVNLSDEYESGVPIGLVNVSRKGSFEGETWVEETGLVFAGLRTGARWMHSHFAVGMKPDGDQRMLAPTLGVSGEFGFTGTPLFLETGLLYSTLYSVKKYPMDKARLEADWSRARMGLGIKPLSFLTIVGGLSYNVMYHPYSDRPLTGSGYRYFVNFDDKVSMWPGAWAGIRVGK